MSLEWEIVSFAAKMQRRRRAIYMALAIIATAALCVIAALAVAVGYRSGFGAGAASGFERGVAATATVRSN